MAKKFLYIFCGVALILFGIFAVAGGLIPGYTYGPISTQNLSKPGVTLGHFTLYPIILTWRFYLLPILFYILFGMYVVYTSFIPRYKISLVFLSITAAFGFASSFLLYNNFLKNGVYTDGNCSFALQSKDSVVKIIRLIIPNIIPYYTPAICAMFTHILLVIFVAVGFVLLTLGRPKKRKTKYWAAGTIGGIVFALTLLSHLYVYFSYSVVYIFGYWDMSPVPYLPLSILFSLATSYGLFRILSVSVLQTKIKGAADN